jgi:hypothetical protein
MNIAITTTGILLYNFPSLFKIFFQSKSPTIEKISVKERIEILDLDMKIEILSELLKKKSENKYSHSIEKNIEKIICLKNEIYKIIEQNKKSWFIFNKYSNIEYKLYILEKEIKILEERFLYLRMLEN